jgi:hypothetical protein
LFWNITKNYYIKTREMAGDGGGKFLALKLPEEACIKLGVGRDRARVSNFIMN